jgi:nitroimidazol reductase NimA-like FMN-containing flavoprotein (pyridoxamine 5'-phosphate oxidase superfamily)
MFFTCCYGGMREKGKMALRDLTTQEVEMVLRQQRIVSVAFANENDIYLIPLGYVWIDGAIWGTTNQGRKMRMAEENPRVVFQIDNAEEGGPFEWHSVLGEGSFEIVPGKRPMARILPKLASRFADAPAWANKEALAQFARGEIFLFRIRPTSLMGKASEESVD